MRDEFHKTNVVSAGDAEVTLFAGWIEQIRRNEMLHFR